MSDDLEEFGTAVEDGSKPDREKSLKPGLTKAGPHDVEITDPSSPGEFRYEQWSIGGNGCFFGAGKVIKILPPGMYKACICDSGPYAERIDIKIDDLLEVPDGLSKQVFDEIQLFWTKESVFKHYGFLHRRGYLLFGPAGSGKTALVQLVCHRLVSEGDIVLVCENPHPLQRVLKMLRAIEPNRRVVCVFEDIDAIVSNYGDSKLLSILDGEDQINRVLNLATTNYPERLDRRLVARPRRFDRVMKIGMPSAQTRHLYLKRKLNIGKDELDTWVEKTEGLSFAALAELVISVKCLDRDFDKTVELLRSMAKSKSSSEDYKTDTGFRVNQPANCCGSSMGIGFI